MTNWGGAGIGIGLGKAVNKSELADMYAASLEKKISAFRASQEKAMRRHSDRLGMIVTLTLEERRWLRLYRKAIEELKTCPDCGNFGGIEEPCDVCGRRELI